MNNILLIKTLLLYFFKSKKQFFYIVNYLDIIICIPLLWGIYKGFTKGFIIQIASVAALILGILCAVWFSGKGEHYLKDWFSLSSKYLPVICFAIVFIVVVIIVFLLGKLLEMLIKIAALGIVNRLLGGVFGIIKYGLIISTVLFVMNRIDEKIKIIPENVKEKSLLYKPISSAIPVILPLIKKISVL